MADKLEVVEKTAVTPEQKKSVVDTPSLAERETPTARPLILSVAAASQTITPWGVNPAQRDKELRSFWPTESWLASVVYSVSIRNASFAWQVVGSDPSKPLPSRTAALTKRMLMHADRGGGWKKFLLKTCIDLYTTDNGAIWEIIRKENNPRSPVINIAHLDSGKCYRTGDPKYPIIYTDRKGIERALAYWQVRTLEEMPSPIESAFDLQVCAVSRALLAAEIIQSIAVYKQEKVGGTFTRAIDVISGVSKGNIDDALALAEEQNLNRGLYRFSLPVIIPGIDPTATLSHIHIDLAALPDNFDEDTSFKWYVAQLAAAFGVDYQEIAPLMTGNLGSSQQSEIMHLKTRGKGPAFIMGLIEDIINDGLVPGNVEFRFLEQDLRSETEKAEARFTRSKERSMRVDAGELDAKAARRIAVEDGDLPLWMADELDARGVEAPAKPDNPGAGQITGGITTQETKMFTPEHVRAIREQIRVDPEAFLVKNRL